MVQIKVFTPCNQKLPMPPLIQLQPPLLSQNYKNQTQQNPQYLYQSQPMIYHPSKFSFFPPHPPPRPHPSTPHPSTLILPLPEFSPPPAKFSNLPYPAPPSAHRGKENKAKEQNKQPNKYPNHGKPPYPNMLPMLVKNKTKIVKNPLGRIDGSRMGEWIENRLRKPTSFVCKMKFRNKLPDLTTQPKILPLKRDPDRYNDQYVVVTFGRDPTVDSEDYKNLNKYVRDAYESKVVMKSCVAKESNNSDETDKFLAYLAPLHDEMSNDINDEEKDVAFSWVREYNYNVQSDDADDPTSYLVSFDDPEAHYLPLPTKLKLRKKKMSKKLPTKVVVRRRSAAEEPAVKVEE